MLKIFSIYLQPRLKKFISEKKRILECYISFSFHFILLFKAEKCPEPKTDYKRTIVCLLF